MLCVELITDIFFPDIYLINAQNLFLISNDLYASHHLLF